MLKFVIGYEQVLAIRRKIGDTAGAAATSYYLATLLAK